MLYNIVFVSAIHQHESAVGVYTCSLSLEPCFHILPHPNPLCQRELSLGSLHHIANPTAYLFIFLGSKINANGDCSHEIKRHLFLGRKARTNLDSILKSRDINLPANVHLVKAMVFPVVRYGCESWTIKKAER